MKTAEEFYKEYYPPKMHLFRDKHDRELQVFGINDMVDFAEQYAKALLEEAAEKIAEEIEDIDVYGMENIGKRSECTTKIDGLKIAEQIILSLIPKDTTKD